jgi:valyl-tRNA synthetase
MSKSRGNVVVPTELLRQYGADAVRYWAASARPGADTAFDPGQMKIGRRLAVKVLNACKFTLGLPSAPAGAAVTEAIDRAMLAQLAILIDEATSAFENYDYARALQVTEEFFWPFCDDYLELVKVRAYRDGPDSASARTALLTAISTLLRLLAPFLPYVTEEAWSWAQRPDGPLPGFTTGSVHRATWPAVAELHALTDAGELSDGAATVLTVATDVLRQIRKAKSDAKRSVRSEAASVTVVDSRPRIAAVQAVLGDLRSAGNVRELITVELSNGAEATIEVQLPDAEYTAR